jgi:hypothetical protein
MLGCAAKVTTHPMVQTPNYKALKTGTVFTASELQRFFSRYISICNDQGLLEHLEFVQQPELTFFPLATMLFMFEVRRVSNSTYLASDEDDNPDDHTINFEGFVRILNVVSPKLSIDNKYKC